MADVQRKKTLLHEAWHAPQLEGGFAHAQNIHKDGRKGERRDTNGGVGERQQ
jgi:hypothetical protein